MTKRLLAAILFWLCLLALCACGQAVPPITTTASPPTTENATTTAQPTTQALTMPPIECPAAYKDAPAAYKPVLDDLYALKQWLWSDGADWGTYNWDEVWAHQYAESIVGAWNESVDGYAVADINHDGTPELLLFQEPHHYLRSLFTLSNGQPVCLGWYGPRNWGDIAASGAVYFFGSGSMASGSTEIYWLEPHAIALTLVAGYEYDHWPPEVDTYYKMVDGKRIIIDEKAYHAITKQYGDANENPLQFNYIPIDQ